ncbi:MAG: M1 family peptidase, partial [Flavobacteriaceae bacterium]
KERLLVLLYQSNEDLRQELLYKTSSIKGRGRHTFRILWLVLSLNTETNPEKQQALYKELINFSSAAYHPEDRQLAFEYLFYMNLVNEKVKSNLKSASSHYNWRFKSFAKKKLSELE